MSFIFGEVDARDVTAPFTAALANSPVTVADTDTSVATANGNRSLLIIGNGDRELTVWVTLAPTGSAVGQGIPLLPGHVERIAYSGAVCAVHDGPPGETARVGVIEL